MLTLLLLAAAAAPDAKTTAMDDWHQLAITGVAGESGGPMYLRVQAGDLDGDGKADEAVMKLVCAAGQVTSAFYVVSPRESASGMATGRRQYAPVKIVKEWGAGPASRSRTPTGCAARLRRRWSSPSRTSPTTDAQQSPLPCPPAPITASKWCCNRA